MAIISIPSLLSKYIHIPNTEQLVNGKKETIVFYTRTEDNKADLTKSEGIILQDTQLQALSKTTFSSPNNVRRLFITGNRVLIQLYRPRMYKGKLDGAGNWYEYKYKKEDNLRDLAIKALNYEVELEAYNISKINGMGELDKPEKIELTGNILSILTRSWVLNNIEEVYIDWTPLVSRDIYYKYPEVPQLIDGILNRGGSGRLNSNILEELLLDGSSGNLQNMRSRFPRLKSIMLISNLDMILDMDYDRGKTNSDAYSEYGKFWFELEINSNLIKSTNNLIIMSTFMNDLERLNTNFHIQTGIYKYDNEILNEFFINLKDRILKYGREQRDKRMVDGTGGNEPGDTEDVGSIGGLELYLNNMAENFGEARAKQILQLSLPVITKADFDEIKSRFSVEGQQKYF